MEAILNYISQGERPIELLKLVVTVAIAYFTVTWSLKKFLREKKWERQSEAYSRIIEALHHQKRINELYVDLELEQREISDERKAEISVRYNSAKNELDKYIDMGRYFISDDALIALEKLYKAKAECVSDWNHDAAPIWDIYEKELAAVKACLEEIKAIAIKEIHK